MENLTWKWEMEQRGSGTNSFPRKHGGKKNPTAWQIELDRFMKGTGWCRAWKSRDEDSMVQKTPLSPTFHTVNSHNDGL